MTTTIDTGCARTNNSSSIIEKFDNGPSPTIDRGSNREDSIGFQRKAWRSAALLSSLPAAVHNVPAWHPLFSFVIFVCGALV